jgi:hypothetical protein
MNTTNNNTPQETFAFRAKSCKNIFSKGKFTQELVGSLITDTATSPNATVNNGRQLTPSVPTSVRDTTNSSVSAADEVNPELWNDGTATTEEDLQFQDNPPLPQPSPPPEDPTSSGDIDVFAGLSDFEVGQQSTPQFIARDD